jgi:glycosyltransferase involved in cell wall biosynthesis
MQGPKKVFLVANTSWYLYNFRKGVITSILRMGHEVFCIAPEDDYTDSLKQLGVQYISVKIDAKGINVLNDLKFFYSLFKIYKKYRPQFIFHYTIKPNIYGSFASNLVSVPNISIVSGAGIVFLKRNFLFRFVKVLYRISARCSKEVWFVNEDDKAFFLKEEIVDRKKIRVLKGEGINTIFFKRCTTYTEIPKPFSFLFSARLLWVKGIEYYVEAARRLKKEHILVNFYMIGFFDSESKVGVKREDVDQWEKEGIIKFLGTFQDVRPILEKKNCLFLT